MKKQRYKDCGERFIERVEGHRLAVCKGGGGGGTSTTTQKIPTELKPLARAYTTKAVGLSNQGFTPYGGDRFEDMNAVQGAGVGGIVDRAMNGSQTIDNAENALNTRFLGESNPYLDSMVQRAQDSVTGNFNNSSINSGSFGNANLMDQYQQNLGDTANQMYGQAYEGDQSRALQAIQMAPTYGNMAYEDAGQLMNAGQFMQDQGQQQKDFDYSQFENQQNLPYKQLAAMSGVFGSNLGGTSTTTQSGGGGK
jgi:hypothetical protein